MDSNIETALSNMILSASGWRGIFAKTGEEESFEKDISEGHRIIAAGAALVFSSYLKALNKQGAIIVARDTRPTGPAISDVMIRVFLKEGWDLRYTDVSAAPEIMAYAKKPETIPQGTNNAAGFVYISASHNPVGHNGLKFGLADGGVLPGTEASVLIKNLKTLMAKPDCEDILRSYLDGADQNKLEKVYSQSSQYKKEAQNVYSDFTKEVISGFPNGKESDETFNTIRQGIKESSLGICADFNGSARAVSIDRNFLASLGIKFRAISDVPGEIKHRIVPEGESLDTCKELLKKCHEEDPCFVLGYMPDCDGDRGNLVIWDNGAKAVRALDAQEVFALACAAELSYLVWAGQLKYDSSGNAITRAALVVNDPTSLRMDRIARAFDVSIFRAEVGEANVVSLARKLREAGYLIRILGEGSNGGNITHPAAVRDPINTLGALIKFLTIRSTEERKGLYELWCDLSDQAQLYQKDFSLADIIASLPAFISTGAYTEEALLKVAATDHGLLKDKYQKIFLRDWEERKDQLKLKYGITSWEVSAHNGTEEKLGLKQFGEAGKGGLTIEFLNDEGRKIAFIWMRGSGTEPIFRIMADAEGSDHRFEKDLIEWQRRMVMEADKERL